MAVDTNKLTEAMSLLKKAEALLDEAGVPENAYSQVSVRDAIDDLDGDMIRASEGTL
jgi:hypothetical protein